MSGGVPATARRIVATAAWLVPAHRRAAWMRQWEADLEELCRRERGATLAVRFALGAGRHALWLRMQEMRMRGSGTDVRFALRGLLRRPGFTLLAVATLAIGIGAASAVFSLAEAMILRPVPFPEGDRLVRVFSSDPVRGTGSFSVSYPDYLDWVRESGLFSASAIYRELDRDISGEGDPERVRVIAVGQDFFQTLGSRFALGRAPVGEDHGVRSPRTAVLTEPFWIRRFGGDPGVVGRTIRLDGLPHTVVGVVAGGQGWPARADVWTPLQWGGSAPSWADDRSNHTWQVIARLQPEVSVEGATARVRELARAVYSAEGTDERDAGIEGVVVLLRASAGGSTAAEILVTMGIAVSLVLLIACMNASGLLLTRAWERASELSVRSALGAGRARLVAALMAESTLLSLLGGGAGVLLGIAVLRRGLAQAAPEISAISDVRLNPWVIGAGLGVSLLSALLSGLVPALRATRSSLSESLKDGSRNAAGGREGARLHRGLIVGEIALSLTLLTGAAVTVQTLRAQLSVDPGFEPEGLISFTVRLPPARYEEPALVDGFWGDAVDRLERLPGVRAATATSLPPLGAPGTSLYRAFVLDGQPAPPEGSAHDALWVEIDPEYFATLGIRPRSGRPLDRDDDANAPPVAMVNREMATRLASDDPVLGRSVRSVYDEDVERTVVGVIDDIQFSGMSRGRPMPVVFVPRAQAARSEMAFLVRTEGDLGDVIGGIRTAIAELDPDVALDRLQTLRDAHAADLGGLRFVTTLFAAFGFLALVLSVGGVYGLVSYSVTRRAREIGMRLAMGATAARVRRGMLGDSARLALIGIAVGSGLAYAAARVLAAGLGEAAVVDAITFGAVIVLMLVAVLLATWIPATGVARVDPAEALRAD